MGACLSGGSSTRNEKQRNKDIERELRVVSLIPTALSYRALKALCRLGKRKTRQYGYSCLALVTLASRPLSRFVVLEIINSVI